MAGIDRQQQAMRGLADFYHKMLGHQLSVYHGITREQGYDLKEGIIKGVVDSMIYRDRIARGGLGSGKTVGGVFTVLSSSVFFPNNEWMVVRKRKEQLRNTFIADFIEVAEIVTDGKPEYLLEDVEGKEQDGAVEMTVYTGGKPSKIIFRIEPDGDDEFVKDSFKAYQLGGFLIEEGSQIKKVVWDMLRGRVRRKNVPHAGILLTNPVTRGHWLNEFAREIERDILRGVRPEAIVIQSSMLDNPFLPADYVEQQKRQYRNDPVGYAMYIEGFDGVKIDGVPVFKGHFETAKHVTDQLWVNNHKTLYRAWDFGWHHPAVVWFQLDERGNVNVLAELLGEQETVEHFANRVLDMQQRLFPEHNGDVMDYGDPAGAQQTDKGDSTIVILAKRGIKIRYRKSTIDSGLNIIRSLLISESPTTAGLRPRILFHPRCQDLIMAFRAGYYYKKNDELVREKPFKDGYYDHLVDAFRYGISNLFYIPSDSGKKKGATFALGAEAVRVG